LNPWVGLVQLVRTTRKNVLTNNHFIQLALSHSLHERWGISGAGGSFSTLLDHLLAMDVKGKNRVSIVFTEDSRMCPVFLVFIVVVCLFFVFFGGGGGELMLPL
jgi:hypothetical protein